MLWVSRDEAEGIHRRQVTWNLLILGGSNHFTEGLQGRVERLGRQWDLTSVSCPGSPQLHSRWRWNLVQCMVGVGASLVTQTVKNLPAMQETPHSILGLGRFPWRREWQPTPVFLPGGFHGQRGLTSNAVHGVAESWTQLRATNPFTFKMRVKLISVQINPF